MKRRLEGVLALLVACALLAGMAFCFYAFERANAKITRDTLYSHLGELARQQNRALTARLNGFTQTVNALSAAAADVSGDPEKTRALLSGICTPDTFSRAGLVNAAGVGFLQDGAPVDLRDYPSLDSPIQYVELPEGAFLVFSAPVAGGATLIACCPESRLSALIGDGASDENGYAFLARGDGQVIVRSNHPSYVHILDNTLDFYREAILGGGVTVEKVAGDLAAGNAGLLAYSYGNQYRYAAYTPVGVNDWFLFSVFQGTQLDQQITLERRQMALLAGGLLLIISALTALLIWHGRRKCRELGDMADRLDQSERLRQIAQQMSYTILFEVDPATGAVVYNDAFERQLGRKPAITNYNQFLLDDAPILADEAPTWRRLAEEMKRGVPKSQVSVRIRHRNGEEIWYRVSFETLYNRDKSAPVRIVGRLANIERQEREQDKQLASAERDELTGLMGHMAFMQRAEKRLAREEDCALLIADIDGFKGARDIDGRYQGDQLLVNMSETMRRVFSKGDLLGRLGGDTFAVLMADAASHEYVADSARALCEGFEDRDGHTCSVGIAMTAGNRDTISEMSHRADKALYRAKLAGKRRFEFYETPEAEPTPRMRVGDANTVVKHCAISLLACEALAVGMDETLREVAQYYRADRAYVIQADPGSGSVRETYCWCAPGCEVPLAPPRQLEDSSLMARALREHHSLSIPLVNEDTVPNRGELETLRQRQVTALYMVPMGKPGMTEGFLCIDNPQDHVGGATLLKQVAACVASALGKAKKS